MDVGGQVVQAEKVGEQMEEKREEHGEEDVVEEVEQMEEEQEKERKRSRRWWTSRGRGRDIFVPPSPWRGSLLLEFVNVKLSIDT